MIPTEKDLKFNIMLMYICMPFEINDIKNDPFITLKTLKMKSY